MRPSGFYLVRASHVREYTLLVRMICSATSGAEDLKAIEKPASANLTGRRLEAKLEVFGISMTG
jgi:hypothetical protein